MERPTTDPPPTEPVASWEVLIWADSHRLADALVAALGPAGHPSRVLEQDAELVLRGRTSPRTVVIGEDGPRLRAQAAFLGVPLILVVGDAPRTGRPPSYAEVRTPVEAALVVDRLVEHQRLAERARYRREPPRRCSRCARPFDATRVRAGSRARRFVKFGSVALCGGCVDELRRLLRVADTPYVEADVSR
jgi:hypothetical protein